MNLQTPVHRITIAHPGHSHESARAILARLVRAARLPGATFLPTYGMAEGWEAGQTERSTTVEIATDEAYFVQDFTGAALAMFRQKAAYRTTNGARPWFQHYTPAVPSLSTLKAEIENNE